jgi:D-lactate dehydrogenase (cytochrome)
VEASALRNALLDVLPDEARVSSGESLLDLHAADLSYHPPRRPDVVVFPETTDEVARVLAFADEHGVPVVPFGVGTSLEGHVIPVRGGITLDLTRMNRIVDLDTANMQATVQAGVTREQLNARVNPEGLFFSVDPGADATLGGMAATNASGTTTVRYGGMRAQVLALEVVLPGGSVIRTGTRAVKSSAGYDLTSLFVGSEGTLGVITELTLRLYGIAEYTVAVRATFPDVDAACRAAVAITGSGVLVTRIELLDAETIRGVNAYKGTDYREEPSLFIEFSGTEAGVVGDLETTREIVDDERCTSFESETRLEGRNRLWEARHHAAFAFADTSPGKRLLVTDVCVPIAELPGAVAHARMTIAGRGLDGFVVGHVGDGNYHAGFMLDPTDAAAIADAQAVSDEIVDYALARGGTCTGEHGIGIGKRQHLRRQHGNLLPYMQRIKHAFDPNGILNPGKILD